MKSLPSQTSKYRLSISRIPLLQHLVNHKAFPEKLQAMLLMAFLILIILGWGHYTPEGIDDKLFAKTNLVTLLVWGIWWPAMILVTVLLGRIWCAVCPLELASRLGEVTAGKVNLTSRQVTRWMKAGWLILILYGVVQMLVATVHLHRVPMYTSLYLATLLGLALLFGLFFRNRAFCRTACPVGLLLKIYGRGGMLAVRPQTSDIKPNPDIIRSCRSLLNPLQLDRKRGTDCLMCLDCVQADRERSCMQFEIRAPWTKHDRRPWIADWPTTLFIMMLSGFVTYEISGFWPSTKALFLWVPSHLTGWLGIHPGLMNGLWTILIYPLTLWTLVALVARPYTRSLRPGDIWLRLAYPASLIVMAAHMTKGVEKLATWAGYLPYSLNDPSGESTARFISQGVAAVPPAVLDISYVYGFGVLAFLVALILLWREVALFSAKSKQLTGL